MDDRIIHKNVHQWCRCYNALETERRLRKLMVSKKMFLPRAVSVPSTWADKAISFKSASTTFATSPAPTPQPATATSPPSSPVPLRTRSRIQQHWRRGLHLPRRACRIPQPCPIHALPLGQRRERTRRPGPCGSNRRGMRPDLVALDRQSNRTTGREGTHAIHCGV